MTSKHKCVFGPVMSRRLGRSLGIDVFREKTCTYDCLYCQVGPTQTTTVERIEPVPYEDVVTEVISRLASSGPVDYATLSGSGEPTLYSRLGDLIGSLKQKTDVPVAVITNGSLLWRPDVQDDLMQADLIVPSLDAGSDTSFRRINRPHSSIDFDTMADGIASFTKRYQGIVWLEVLLINGSTSLEDEVDRIAALAEKIAPDKVHLNTAVRPPAHEEAVPIGPDRLASLADRFTVPVEVATQRPTHTTDSSSADDSAILALLARRPCSVRDIAQGIAIPMEIAQEMVSSLSRKGIIQAVSLGQTVFYKLAGS